MKFVALFLVISMIYLYKLNFEIDGKITSWSVNYFKFVLKMKGGSFYLAAILTSFCCCFPFSRITSGMVGMCLTSSSSWEVC